MRWSVYRSTRKGSTRVVVALGYVRAKHQPDALQRACKRWPEHIDEGQTQRGFSVRPYATDYLSLGKLHRRASR